MRKRLGVLAGALLVLAGCSTPSTGTTETDPVPESTTIPGSLRPSANTPMRDPRTVLSMVPESATTLTITDWDAIRARLGFHDLSSNEPMSERRDFWERASRKAVLLTDGLLRAENSRLMLDYGFTQDDVDWEARFTGPEGRAGYVLGFRPGQDMSDVAKAVDAKVGPLRGSRVVPGRRLLVLGVAAAGERVWAMDPAWLALTDGLGETSYLRSGCIPVNDALGPDATVEDQAALVSQMDPTYLRPLEGFSVSFSDEVATARLGVDRMDLQDRADLPEIWPTTGDLGFSDGFDAVPVADAASGRIGLRVADPPVAAGLTLTEQLPFAVCNKVEPLPEPTGL